MKHFLVLLLAACGTDDPAPTATIRAVTPDSLQSSDDALDDLTITVDYTDADGDLGGGTAEVHDCRADGLVTTLVIPAIASKSVVDGDAGIQGALDLHVNDIGVAASSTLPVACADLGVDELGAGEAVFCVFVVDAAGHRSAGDCTQVVSIE